MSQGFPVTTFVQSVGGWKGWKGRSLFFARHLLVSTYGRLKDFTIGKALNSEEITFGVQLNLNYLSDEQPFWSVIVRDLGPCSNYGYVAVTPPVRFF